AESPSAQSHQSIHRAIYGPKLPAFPPVPSGPDRHGGGRSDLDASTFQLDWTENRSRSTWREKVELQAADARGFQPFNAQILASLPYLRDVRDSLIWTSAARKPMPSASKFSAPIPSPPVKFASSAW